MAADLNGGDRCVVGVVGAGAMGRGIAQICVQAGFPVTLHDVSREAAEAARQAVADTLATLAGRGKISAEAAEQATGLLSVAGDLDGLAAAAVVIEAIVERLDAKQALFSALEQVVAEDAILATNTSSLSVTAIASACRLPQRVAGFHFFNPVPLMKVVEVVRGLQTQASVLDRLDRLAQACGHRPVRTEDTPGFLVNHAGRGLSTEGLRILQEGIAAPATIDRVMREVAGFRMGPFELMDLTGLDVSRPVMELIYSQFHQEPRFRPSPLVAQRLAAGLFGRKSGRGWYVYEGTAKQEPPELPLVEDAAVAPIWVSPSEPLLAARLETLLGITGAALDLETTPGPDSICLVTPVGTDATTTALAQGLDPARVLAVDMLFEAALRLTVMPTPVTTASARHSAVAALQRTSLPVSLIEDSAGFIAQRIVAMIVNIACDIAQQKIATPADIDDAVRLGLGYPYGPLTLGDRVGPAVILRILEGCQDFYGDPRYRPSPWLKRRARLGVSLLTEAGAGA
ncbi:3-hydroxybutyryl-CoA dehydrogenase [Rhodoligotrophos appendicifer]|uniref:3-hydroxyacyl-CoA dehydrogenase n=1 Tax=Rhodoligotrophos appendicifer TaxID=987056 RepID=UPI001FE73727|nr:3-hydroxyacyl-CoA dehydrogenase [Rhodoligotrophos appendicifer]